MAAVAADSNSNIIPYEHHSFTHIPSPVDFGPEEKQNGIVTMLNAMLSKMNETNLTLNNVQFNDVSPTLPYNTRVSNGKVNEEIAKSILRLYGFTTVDVPRNVDMYQKIDFYLEGDFGRLGVQFKNRNCEKNSRKNDLGIEYCRVKFASGGTKTRAEPSRGLETHVGRDRFSIADVYLSIDAVNNILHWMPTWLIEKGAFDLHDPYEIIVEQLPCNFHSPTGRIVVRPQWTVAYKNKDQEGIIRRDARSITLSHPDIGEIRYFRPHREREGVFKAMFYLNDNYTGQFSYQLPM